MRWSFLRFLREIDLPWRSLWLLQRIFQPEAERPVPGLAVPVGALVREAPTVEEGSSFAVVVREFQASGSPVLFVVRLGVCVGAITESTLIGALAAGECTSGSSEQLVSPAATIPSYATAAEALRQFDERRAMHLAVIDDKGVLLGMITASALYPSTSPRPRPALVGGMATPFGVYLTGGGVRGGVKAWALVSTGAFMFALLFVASLLSDSASAWLAARGVGESLADSFAHGAALVLFLLGIRLAPLSGYHGAEHQVVHALERGEPLVPEAVRRMPRVHPRCGTNLAAGFTLFLGVFTWDLIPGVELRLIAALLVTVMLWKPLGSLLQQYLTTRRPSDKQLASGISAAEDLLANYQTTRTAQPSIARRLWSSGLPYVIAGSLLMLGLVALVSWAFGLGWV